MSKPLPSPDGTPISYFDEQSKPTKTPNPEALSAELEDPIQTPSPQEPKPPAHRGRPYLRRGEPIKVLTVIDVYGWAYDEGCRGLYRELAKRHPDWTLDTACFREITEGTVNPRDYDVVLVWCWYEVQGSRLMPYLNLLSKLDMRHSVLCIAGMYVLPMLDQAAMYLREVFYMAGNNQAITETLKKRSKYTRVYRLEFGVDLEKFTPTPLPPTFTVGWAGHQGRALKRFNMAEEICRLADVPLRIAGHISSDHYVPSEDMPSWYDGNTVQLITSDSEAHPLVYYEAMAKGRIPLSTLVGDIPDTAEHGVNGYYFTVDAPISDYVETINRIKNNRPLLERLSVEARRSVEEKWQWSRVANSYEEAILEVAGAYSSCMLVSRTDNKMETALRSVLERHPWEMRIYVDPIILSLENQRKVKLLIHGMAQQISPETELVVKNQVVTACEDHHDDVTRAVHTAILEAKHRLVLWCDDDDVTLVKPEDILYRVGDGIGVVYGNVVQLFSNGTRVHRHGAPISSPIDMANMKGSVILYNRDAFRQVYRNIDAQKLRHPRSPRDYGYFWDYKIAYWLMRAGYVLRYYNEDFSVQNVNPNPGAKRTSLYSDWPAIVEHRDAEKLILEAK